MASASGSIGVLSEAIHSSLDLISSLVTYFVVRASAKPADWDHPFGHGKLENLSALLETFLLLLAGGYIVFESVDRWKNPHHLVHVDWALGAIGLSVLLNLVVYLQNRNVGRDEESIAIETNALHFLADIFSSLAVFVGLGLLWLTGLLWIDQVVGLFVAGYIFWISIAQMKKSIAELSDTALPSDELKTIEGVLRSYEREYIDYHDLKTRKAGPARYVEFHMEVCSEIKVKNAHEVCDKIEVDLMKAFREAAVSIHIEPCGNHTEECKTVCRFYKVPRQEVRS